VLRRRRAQRQDQEADLGDRAVQGQPRHLFCKLFWKLATEYRDARRIHIIVDNYIIHSSKRTQHFLAQFGDRVVLHFLPPHCPDDNRIERVWLDLHANVTRNHRCKTIEEPMVHVIAFMRAYKPARNSQPLTPSPFGNRDPSFSRQLTN
jgi:transposase